MINAAALLRAKRERDAEAVEKAMLMRLRGRVLAAAAERGYPRVSYSGQTRLGFVVEEGEDAWVAAVTYLPPAYLVPALGILVWWQEDCG